MKKWDKTLRGAIDGMLRKARGMTLKKVTSGIMLLVKEDRKYQKEEILKRLPSVEEIGKIIYGERSIPIEEDRAPTVRILIRKKLEGRK